MTNQDPTKEQIRRYFTQNKIAIHFTSRNDHDYILNFMQNDNLRWEDGICTFYSKNDIEQIGNREGSGRYSYIVSNNGPYRCSKIYFSDWIEDYTVITGKEFIFLTTISPDKSIFFDGEKFNTNT